MAGALRTVGLFAVTAIAEIVGGYTYAAYGGVYVTTALVWMWLVEAQRPDRWDVTGAAVAVARMAIIAFAPHAG